MSDSMHWERWWKHFPGDDIAAVRKWAASAGVEFYKCSMLAFVHCWRKCIASGGDDVE
jgi:hypothetical protein